MRISTEKTTNPVPEYRKHQRHHQYVCALPRPSLVILAAHQMAGNEHNVKNKSINKHPSSLRYKRFNPRFSPHIQH